jgi:hypothetical protein
MGAQIPVIAEKPLAACDCRKFQVDALGDHLCTCITHSGVKKTHDWVVDKFGDLFFRTTHKVKTQQVVKRRGQYCGDIELAGYLANVSGPVPLVMDLRVAHDRFVSSVPSLNGHLRYPNNLDKSLNDVPVDKIRKYRAYYNNNPPSVVAFMSVIASTSGRLHSEFIRILFLQVHRETDHFFADSGVLSAQSDRGFLHYHRAAFSSILKSRVGNILGILDKSTTLRINLNLDGVPMAKWHVRVSK